MSFIDHVNRWVASNRETLARADTFAATDSGDGQLKRLVQVAVEGRDRVAELLVWDTGEAEFGFGVPGGALSFEHHDLVDTAELDQLLARFLARARDALPQD
jgi:hypothetical protein